jgi:hypothetical protein
MEIPLGSPEIPLGPPFEKGASAMDGARKGKCQEAAFSRRLEEPLKGQAPLCKRGKKLLCSDAEK